MTGIEDLDLTISQRAAVEELQKRIANDLDQIPYDKSCTYYRFLKARDFDVNQAEIMLRNSLQWRKKYQVNTIQKDYKRPELFVDYLVNLQISYDDDGCPVFYLAAGKLDVKGMMMSVKYTDVIKTFIQIVDDAERQAEKKCKKSNKQVPGFIFILDADELTFAQATDKTALELFIALFKILQDNYPERLKAFYVINASSYFAIAFNVCKNFLARSVLNKLYIFANKGWKEELLKTIDAEKLPSFLGGKMTDPDGNPLCKSFVNHCGKIDEKYYIHNSKKSLAKSTGVEKLVLSRASFSEVPVEISEPGSLIEWEFETKTRDIAFGVFYREIDGDDERNVELVPLQRLNTDDYSETGMYRSDKSGTYIILFDNSYSWLRSKEIYYKVNVITPKDYEKRMQ